MKAKARDREEEQDVSKANDQQAGRKNRCQSIMESMESTPSPDPEPSLMSIVCGARFPSKEVELLEDGRVFYFPHRVGRTMLLCGRRSSFFPFQLFVGPDWPCMLVTYALIIVPTVLFINNIAVGWGGGVIFVTALLAFSVLVYDMPPSCHHPPPRLTWSSF